jgi:hypothetical protein
MICRCSLAVVWVLPDDYVEVHHALNGTLNETCHSMFALQNLGEKSAISLNTVKWIHCT